MRGHLCEQPECQRLAPSLPAVAGEVKRLLSVLGSLGYAPGQEIDLAEPQSSTIDNASFGHRRTACSTRSRNASGGCSCLICSLSSSSTTKISGTSRAHTALLSQSVRFTTTRMLSSSVGGALTGV